MSYDDWKTDPGDGYEETCGACHAGLNECACPEDEPEPVAPTDDEWDGYFEALSLYDLGASVDAWELGHRARCAGLGMSPPSGYTIDADDYRNGWRAADRDRAANRRKG